ncbi:glycoside hydrolase family 31 protein [Thozetella sp. PMI_491]|nr:glycoside hydrolase family 31 protein [Thozetella sp. PMI_491]
MTAKRPVFTIPPSANVGMNILPNIEDPEAVDAQSLCPGYIATDARNDDAGFAANLRLAGSPCNVYGNDVEELTLMVKYHNDDLINIQIQPRYLGADNETWFLLPEILVPRPTADPEASVSLSKLEFSWSNDPSFSFAVRHKETRDILFTTLGSVLVYEDQFVEFCSPLPENYNLYGLGETIHGLRLGNNLTRTMFAADIADAIDQNLYGSHPIYLDTRYFTKSTQSGSLAYTPNATDKDTVYQSFTHGVFLRNAHAQEVTLQPSGITWRAIGGNIDLSFYNGPNPQDVIQLYQLTTVGLPAMQQYWTLGFHQCRYGYQNWSTVQDVVDQFEKSGIPLEAIWTDIDYMNQYRNFDNDARRFSYNEGAKFLSRLHANKQHYVPIVDSAIYAPNPENESDAYAPYTRGTEANAFMMNPDMTLYYGAVWPVFPDWVGAVLNGTGAIDWWMNEISAWHKQIKFDGIWIDMSEASAFCVGSCGTGNLSLNPVHPPWSDNPGVDSNLVSSYREVEVDSDGNESSDYPLSMAPNRRCATSLNSTTTEYFRSKPTPGVRNVNYPPYAINNGHRDLAVSAVSPNATHHGGSLQYDFHNLFGHQILNATYHGLLKISPEKRPFIIGRGTFAGSGKFAGHWGGDNYSLWAYLFFSIPQALSFSIFGIPMFGVDACGFIGDADHELCSRWMQLSAFFPFYRNHNNLESSSQEPYVWPSVADATKTAMRIRYALLPYIYTLFALANREGITVLRALAWEFPNEPWLASADRQFMLGGAIMVTPCLIQGATAVDGIFPGVADGVTVWYDWYNQTAVANVRPGENVTIAAPLGHIPVYVRGGSVIPLQEPGMTTSAARNSNWALLAALDLQGVASGSLYLDDGESLAPITKTWVKFTATSTYLAVQIQGDFAHTNPLENITLMGIPVAPSHVMLNGDRIAKDQWTYNKTSQSLFLTGLQKYFISGAWAYDFMVRWS